VSTPYMDEAARFTRVGFMYAGQILVEGAPRQLTASLEGRVLELAAHPKQQAAEVARADPAVEDVIAFGDRLHLRVRDAAGALDRLPPRLAAAGVGVTRLRPVSASMEDVFISLLAERSGGEVSAVGTAA
jgi:ABC-2 type transport system ATP-binding protein